MGPSSTLVGAIGPGQSGYPSPQLHDNVARNRWAKNPQGRLPNGGKQGGYQFNVLVLLLKNTDSGLGLFFRNLSLRRKVEKTSLLKVPLKNMYVLETLTI